MNKNQYSFICMFLCIVISIVITGSSLLMGSYDPYVVQLPEGKLPWPHHRPDLSEEEYQQLLADLFLVNNYGMYQGGGEHAAYFHDGLDIVLPNGTPIYAIESGYVKAVRVNKPETGEGVIIIGDTEGDLPGQGWSYVHTKDFLFKKGDYVRKGDQIAVIQFDGLEHLHLSRVFLATGKWESYGDLVMVHPDSFFIYTDTLPPVIKTPFYFFENNTDNLFSGGELPVVRGNVDIVVGINDPGENATIPDIIYGNRHAVAKIEYEISGMGIPTIYKKSFDFTKMWFRWSFTDHEKVYTIFKHNMLFYNTKDEWYYDNMKQFYIITNTPGEEKSVESEVDVQDGNFAWNTHEKDENGNPRFPNGIYTVRVTAYDYMGNSSTAVQQVKVRNLIKKGIIRR